MWQEILKEIFIIVMSKIVLKIISSKDSRVFKALKNNPYEISVLVCLAVIAVGVWTIVKSLQ